MLPIEELLGSLKKIPSTSKQCPEFHTSTIQLNLQYHQIVMSSRWFCPIDKAGVLQVLPHLIRCTVVLICTGQGKLVYNGSLLSPALCEIMWIRVMCPPPLLHPSYSSPYPSYFGLSLLAAKSVISGHRTMCEHSHLFCYQYYFCGALLKYFLYLVLIVVIFLG